MGLSATLSAYLARQFAFWLASVFAALSAVVLLFDSIEMLRRSAGKSAGRESIPAIRSPSIRRLPETIPPGVTMRALFRIRSNFAVAFHGPGSDLGVINGVLWP